MIPRGKSVVERRFFCHSYDGRSDSLYARDTFQELKEEEEEERTFPAQRNLSDNYIVISH